MSLLNSVLGSISPSRFRDSFEDLRAPDHELPLSRSPSSSRSPSQAPRIPPPIASTVLWSVPPTHFKPAARVPDELLALQRRARHLEQQLQELLDAQADGLMGGLAGKDSNIPDDLVSNGSTTPTVSSVRSSSHSGDGDENSYSLPRKKKVGLTAARKGIYKRIQQLASVKAEELNQLDEDLQDLNGIVGQTDTWTKKRARLEQKIQDIEQGESSASRTQALHTEASNLEREIRQREEELAALKARYRSVRTELENGENAVESKLSSYKASLAILDKNVASFLARPPDTNHVSLAASSYLSLPPRRRTLEMAHDYWTDEHMRLVDKCEEVDIERAALDEGAILWNDVVKKITTFETALQDMMQQGSRAPSPSRIIAKMDATITYLEEQVDFVKSRDWNLLFLAIAAELEAFKQGKDVLEDALGLKKSKKGKEKAIESLVDTDDTTHESDEEVSRSAIRIPKEPPKPAVSPPKQSFFDTDNEDPDPELMISHQDTDTD
ncbi:uncharacterized protein N0V89_003324 [Didymosphaeria variabile]|uniref:Uncharacterized protein n=1 Tax=Didymosphaeria variabile TaxID=1932322 RepID=A0A9W8XVW5_9PLEO|nr:uncharacterized protein N0V89_003324 [Didymosphaeria variabile]KAJ4358740.1 hypothetical protein N0V89_003324 [Didymosphaeria variabile]